MASVSEWADLYTIVKEAVRLVAAGETGEIDNNKPWALLPLAVCESISGRFEQALPAAAALVFLRAAADVFDDIEDADSASSLAARYGIAPATNAATTLVILAEKALARLRGRGVGNSTIVQVFDAVNAYYTTACAGQHLDLAHPVGQSISESDYLSIAGMKSATSIACACHAGALLGGANAELIDTFSRFGYNLGMASQLANDIEGVTQGRDLLKRKVTLPAIYALAHADAGFRQRLEQAFTAPAGGASDLSELRQILFASGAMHYASVTMEFYREKASDILTELERGGTRVDRLRFFAT